jgi:amidase
LTQAGLLLVVEAWHSNRTLVAEDPEGIGDGVRARLELGGAFDDAVVRAAWETQREWQASLERVLDRVDFIVSPTLTIFPPRPEEGDDLLVSRCTLPANLAGVPALSLPVPTGGPLPASLQLIGAAASEERLLAAGAMVELAVAAG